MSKKVPKVLIVGPIFNLSSGSGITMTNLFKGWDKDNLAVIAERIDKLDLSVCTKYYQLGYFENKRKFPFNLLEKKYPSGEIDLSNMTEKNEVNQFIPNSEKFKNLTKIYNFLYHFFGIYHAIRQIQLTDKLFNWINDFAPDIIYTHLSSLELIRFVSQLQEKTKRPIVVHIMDDWPTTISEPGLFQKYWRTKINDELRRLFDNTTLFLSICDVMSEEYKLRYNKDFTAFHNPIEIRKWSSIKHKEFDEKNIKLLYTGRIGLGIDLSLQEIALAIQKIITSNKYHIEFIIQTPVAPKWISKYSFISQKFVDDYSLYPQSLGDADILVLPYDFSKKSMDYIRYSFPTKASEYMISGTPILLYASDVTAISIHAFKNKWANIVNKQDIGDLANAIIEIIENQDKRKTYTENAYKFAVEYFDAEKIRIQFQQTLNSII